MVNMITVDRGFKPRSGQTYGHNIVICCFYNRHTAIRSKSKDSLVQNQKKMCPTGTTYISANCLVSLALKKSN